MIRRVLWWLAVAIGVAAELQRPQDAAPMQLAFFAAIFAGIVTVFQFIAGHAVTVAVTIAQAAVMIGQAIGAFALLAAHVFARVFGFLRSFWSGVLRPFITWSAQTIERVAGWLRRTFEPIIKFLNDIRTEIQKIYDKWLRPVFDTIDATRRILQVLATLRVPFARELDRKLAELEDFLLRPILELYRLLNTAMDWINRIVTLDGLLQRVTLLRSVARDVGRIGAIWHAAHSRPLTAAEKDAIARENPWPTSEQILAESRTYVATGTGPQSALIAELVLDSRRRLGVG